MKPQILRTLIIPSHSGTLVAFLWQNVSVSFLEYDKLKIVSFHLKTVPFPPLCFESTKWIMVLVQIKAVAFSLFYLA